MPGIYDMPDGNCFSAPSKLYINAIELPVLAADTYPPPYVALQKMPFSAFDLADGETVLVRYSTDASIDCASIRPLSSGIIPILSEHELTFSISSPACLSIEINDDPSTAHMLFANPTIQPPIQDENDAQELLFFKPGFHEIGVLHAKPHQTIYIDGGAFLHGFIDASGADGLIICGHGVLCGSGMQRSQGHGHLLFMENSKNVSVNGITLLDSPGWSLRIHGCEDVSIQNVKIFGCRSNTDGIDVCGSRRVTVSDCFVRGNDDCLVVKAFDTGDTRDLLFTRCVLWNDFARAMEVGYEHRANVVENVTFRDIDVIHALSGYPITGIHHGDRAEIRNVVFDDIRIEHAPSCQLFDINIRPAVWNSGTSEPGCIHGVTFSRLRLIGEPGIDFLPEPPRLCGWSDKACVRDVEIIDLCINGKMISSASECGLILGEHVSDVRFSLSRTPENTQIAVETDASIDGIKAFSITENGTYLGKIRLKVRNLSHSLRADGRVWISVFPAPNDSANGRNELVYSLAPGCETSAEQTLSLSPGKYFVMAQTDRAGMHRGWKVLELPVPLSMIDTSKPSNYRLFDYDIKSFTGLYAGKISLSDVKTSDERGLFVFAAIDDISFGMPAGTYRADSNRPQYTSNPPAERAELRLYAAMPVIPEDNEAAFQLPETICGLTTAITHDGNGSYRLAPELRNIYEVTKVFKNQPKTAIRTLRLLPETDGSVTIFSADERIDVPAHCSPSPGGYQLTAFIPYELLGIIPEKDEDFLFDASVSFVPDGSDFFRECTLFPALCPDECSFMFARMRFLN